MSEVDKTLLAEMFRGAELMFSNAEQLYNEAQLLGSSGHFARAACLHQISMEECSKVDILGASALGMTMGHVLDLEKLTKQMTKHEVKNFNNAYFSLTTDEEHTARTCGDFEKAAEIFDKQRREIHRRLNDIKNGGLYVDYIDGRFVAPRDRVIEAIAIEMQKLNTFFLKHAQNHVNLLTKLASGQQDAMRDQVDALFAKLKDLRDVAPDKVVEVFSERLEAWMEEQNANERAAKS